MSETTISPKPAAPVLCPIVTHSGPGLALAMIVSTFAPFALSAFKALMVRLGAVAAVTFAFTFTFTLGRVTPTLGMLTCLLCGFVESLATTCFVLFKLLRTHCLCENIAQELNGFDPKGEQLVKPSIRLLNVASLLARKE